jgi:hypothetical protein
MTSQLQLLDISIKKLFKHLVRKHYDTWLNKDNHISTPSGKIKRASASIIMEWISRAWKEEPDSRPITPKSLLKCCLSNEGDGMQDDILWYDSEQSDEGASSSENESATVGSLDKLSDYIKKIEKNEHAVKILNFHFILVYFTLLFTLNLF